MMPGPPAEGLRLCPRSSFPYPYSQNLVAVMSSRIPMAIPAIGSHTNLASVELPVCFPACFYRSITAGALKARTRSPLVRARMCIAVAKARPSSLPTNQLNRGNLPQYLSSRVVGPFTTVRARSCKENAPPGGVPTPAWVVSDPWAAWAPIGGCTVMRSRR